MASVLVIDDEENIRVLVQSYLEADGFSVFCAEDGQQGLALYRRHRPEFVVLDILLPEINGLEVLRQLQKEGDPYVLMLTAKSDEIDRVSGLVAGADDYITKPFSPRELVARIHAIIRRKQKSGSGDNNSLNFTNISINADSYRVQYQQDEIDLTALEFKLLYMLACNPGVVLSRERIIEKVWGYDFYGDERIVDVHIGNIRQKLEPEPGNPRHLITVRGVGYKFEDEVE